MRKAILCVLLTALFFIQSIAVLQALGSETAGTVVTSSTRIRGNNHSYQPSISSDGRFVAFHSNASNLIVSDTNNRTDIFVFDRSDQSIERVSISSSGAQANNSSYNAAISSDGRFVAFRSAASNLVSGDNNRIYDIFVHDRQAHTTERVSVSSTGIQGNGISNQPSISSDGRFVAFRSAAGNLIKGDNNNGYDIFVRDRLNHTTEMVSVSSNGIQQNSQSYEPSISSNGRFIAFRSWANNLVPRDTNKVYDIFVHDRQAHTTERVSVSSTGIQGNGWSFMPSISSDGRFVAFHSDASNLAPKDNNRWADIFVHDRLTKATERLNRSEASVLNNTYQYQSSPISSDGRFITFRSAASDLVSDDTNKVFDVFVYDRTLNTIERVSVSSTGDQSNFGSDQPCASADGRYVVFNSSANNLVPGDIGWMSDIFVFDRMATITERINTQLSDSEGINRTINPTQVPPYNYYYYYWSDPTTTTASYWPYTVYPMIGYWYLPGLSEPTTLSPLDLLSLYGTSTSW